MWDSERAQMLVDAQVGLRKHCLSCLLWCEGDNLLMHPCTEVPGFVQQAIVTRSLVLLPPHRKDTSRCTRT